MFKWQITTIWSVIRRSRKIRLTTTSESTPIGLNRLYQYFIWFIKFLFLSVFLNNKRDSSDFQPKRILIGRTLFIIAKSDSVVLGCFFSFHFTIHLYCMPHTKTVIHRSMNVMDFPLYQYNGCDWMFFIQVFPFFYLMIPMSSGWNTFIYIYV